MNLMKTGAILLALSILGTILFAQTTVEEEYMSSVEDIIIMELASSDEKENKEIALQYLRDAADGGNVSPDMMSALELLATEGLSTQTRRGRRLMNNHPEVRRQACEILGKVATPEAAQSLNKVLSYDKEPYVLSSAVYSLGEIGYNDNDVITNSLAWYTNKIRILTPSSSLSLEVINAYDKLSGNVTDVRPVVASLTQMANDSNLVTPVRNRAKEVLGKYRSLESKKKQ